MEPIEWVLVAIIVACGLFQLVNLYTMIVYGIAH